MKSGHKIHETPKERLMRIARYSLRHTRKLSSPVYSKAVAAVVLLIFIMLAVAFLGGSSALDIMRAHIEQVKQWVSQLRR